MRSEEDGQILADSKMGRRFGFTSDKFDPGASWLWKVDGSVYLSMIWVHEAERNKGHTQALISSIRKAGYTVKVPTPLGPMNLILKKMGFKRKDENTEMGICEMWVLNDKEEK